MSYYNIDELYQITVIPRDTNFIKNVYRIILIGIIMLFFHIILITFKY